MRSRLRALTDQVGHPLFMHSMQGAAQYDLDGIHLDFPMNGAWDDSEALMIAGDFSQLVYSIRQDVTYKVLTSQLAAGVKARMLMDEYQKTVKGVCKQPAPTLASREEVREMFHKHGGYMVEEADRPE